jgi:tetratricopeptide (TPR) repeat protein
MDPKKRASHFELGRTLNNLVELLVERGALKEARPLIEQAIVHQRAALQLAPGNGRHMRPLARHLLTYADILVRQGEQDAVVSKVKEAITLDPDNPGVHYNAACIFSRCPSLGDQAVEELRIAVAKGYKDFAHLKADKDLDPLRSRADFQKLAQELEAQTVKKTER